MIISFLLAFTVLSSLFYTKPLNFVDKPDTYYATNEGSTTVKDEYLPIWVNESKEKRANSKIETDSSVIVSNMKISPANYSFNSSSAEVTNVRVNSIYFPGWQAKVDDKIQTINYQNKNGLIEFKLPKGEHEVIIKYGKTPIHLYSEIISLVFLTSLIGSIFYFSWLKKS